ncbi:alpha/beta fold hydrolase [Halomarina oriensis]|uniref:Alpha/beta fold hydrolase n=1 Tax=Halomarina oriensis TaxID=671145 RepID=A0A6B0GVA7_9EURY|nr:alpha/beta hydrolase [Halomarina oriensis]MWG36065.1 alpha/beta fold hydrolase [Halomarina oriensis]
MQRVEHDGRTTTYRQTAFGEGVPTLYVHGSGGAHSVWVHQYGSRGFDGPSVALDLSGHGESDDVDTDPGPETMTAYVEDVVAVARRTGARVLVGNSLGGAIALTVALDTDLDLTGLVLTGTGAKLGVSGDLEELLAEEFEAAVETLHGPDMLFHDADDETRTASIAAMEATGRAVTERDFLTCDAFDVRERLDEVAVPTLALTGEHDRLTPPSFHEYLADELPSSSAVTVEDAAHLSMLEHPDAWNDAVEPFLAGQ